MIHLRQLAWSSLAGGVFAGVLLFVLQAAWITPLIREAERYENRVPGSPSQSPAVSSTESSPEKSNGDGQYAPF